MTVASKFYEKIHDGRKLKTNVIYFPLKEAEQFWLLYEKLKTRMVNAEMGNREMRKKLCKK